MPDGKTDEKRQKNAARQRPHIVIFMLIHDEFILLKIRSIFKADRMFIKKNPSNVAVPETPFGIMGVLIRIGKLMMLAVLGGPFQRGFFVSRGSKEKKQKPDETVGFVGSVCKEAVIADSDRHAGGKKIEQKEKKFSFGKPVTVEVNRGADDSAGNQDGK